MAEAVRPEKKRKKAKKIDKASPKIQRQSPSTKWFVEDTAQDVDCGMCKAFILLIFVEDGLVSWKHKLLGLELALTVTVGNILYNFISFSSGLNLKSLGAMHEEL